ncbi:hypothetical protein ACFX15_021292 [Malus domestica]
MAGQSKSESTYDFTGKVKYWLIMLSPIELAGAETKLERSSLWRNLIKRAISEVQALGAIFHFQRTSFGGV